MGRNPKKKSKGGGGGGASKNDSDDEWEEGITTITGESEDEEMMEDGDDDPNREATRRPPRTARARAAEPSSPSRGSSIRHDETPRVFFSFGDGGSSRVPLLRLERRSAFSFPDVPAAPQTRVDDSINNLSIP